MRAIYEFAGRFTCKAVAPYKTKRNNKYGKLKAQNNQFSLTRRHLSPLRNMSVTTVQQLNKYKALTGINDSVESQLTKLTFSGFVFN